MTASTLPSKHDLRPNDRRSPLPTTFPLRRLLLRPHSRTFHSSVSSVAPMISRSYTRWHAQYTLPRSECENGVRNSIQSSTSSITSTMSSPSCSTKCYSNNLFGSGRLRYYSYLKCVASSNASVNSSCTPAVTPAESSTRNMSATSLRPSTP